MIEQPQFHVALHHQFTAPSVKGIEWKFHLVQIFLQRYVINAGQVDSRGWKPQHPFCFFFREVISFQSYFGHFLHYTCNIFTGEHLCRFFFLRSDKFPYGWSQAEPAASSHGWLVVCLKDMFWFQALFLLQSSGTLQHLILDLSATKPN